MVPKLKYTMLNTYMILNPDWKKLEIPGKSIYRSIEYIYNIKKLISGYITLRKTYRNINYILTER